MYIPKKLSIVFLIVVLAAVGITWVFAQDTTPELIFACVNNGSGTIKIVEEGIVCANNEVPLSWTPGESVSPSNGGGIFSFYGQYITYPGEDIHYLCYGVAGASSQCGGPWSNAPVPGDGDLVAFSVYPGQNERTGSTSFTIFVNDAPTPITVDIPAGSNEVQTISTPIPVQSGDLIQLVAEGYAPFPPPDINGERIWFSATLMYQSD